jgi:hypothetical protein
MHDPSRGLARVCSIRMAVAASIAAAGLVGCTYYAPPPYGAPYTVSSPASVDRSWDAVLGAMADNGVGITAQDRAGGMVSGRRGGIEVVSNVRPQADGSVRVEFNSRGNVAEDPKLIERVSASYERRMGR